MGNEEQEPSFDILSPEQRSERMSRVRDRDSGLELTVRAFIDEMGYKYRLHEGNLPGKPDVVFPDSMKVIFIHGCFWHRHSTCHNGTRETKSKRDYWIPKLEGNKKRDLEEQDQLRQAGWDVLVLWECEIKKNKVEELKERLRYFLEVGE
jgi:DNA mismatch endonuclease (patch repair protein)